MLCLNGLWSVGRRCVLSSLGFIAFLCASSPALAADDEPKLRSVALTVSPLHLFSPIVEITGEVRLAPKFGAAAILGFGSISADAPDASGEIQKESFTAWEAGASARLYAVGDFDHGMQLGVELLYIHVDLEDERVSGTGSGIAVGPFIGYKISTDAGFTFDSQLGVQYLAVQAEASSSDLSAEGEDDGFIPLLNLNVGWAF